MVVGDWAEVAGALGITMEWARTLRPIPITVTNQGAGFGLALGGSRVVDFHFLRVYLSTGEYLAGMAVHREKKQAIEHYEPLYRSEQEAADKFEGTMEDPPPLRRYLRAAVWRDSEFPTSDGTNMKVEFCLLGDAFTRDAETAAAILNQ